MKESRVASFAAVDNLVLISFRDGALDVSAWGLSFPGACVWKRY